MANAEPVLQAALPAAPSALIMCTLHPCPSRKRKMATPKVATDIAQLWQQGIRSAHRFDEWTQGWSGMLVGAAHGSSSPTLRLRPRRLPTLLSFPSFPLRS